jgi:anti-anti-sigma factor
MEFHLQKHGAVTVIKPSGPLMAADADAFRAKATETASASLGRLVVDASAIPFVDSTGLEALLDVTEELAKGGRALKLCAATPTLREVLDITGLASAFEYFTDVNTAVRSFL